MTSSLLANVATQAAVGAAVHGGADASVAQPGRAKIAAKKLNGKARWLTRDIRIYVSLDHIRVSVHYTREASSMGKSLDD
ncbi:MAG: hypothetical protein AAGC71_18400 [Pseudomonadota bacterium]